MKTLKLVVLIAAAAASAYAVARPVDSKCYERCRSNGLSVSICETACEIK